MKKYLVEVEACPKTIKVPVGKSSENSIWLEFEDREGYQIYCPEGYDYWCPKDLFDKVYKEIN